MVQYQYNLAGQVTQITYPTNRQVSQSYDGLGRPTVTASGGIHYLTIDPALGYNGAGQVTNLTLGNNVLGQFQYNDHLQISSLRYYKDATDILDLGYDYGAANNGQIQTVHYYTAPGVEDQTRSESFTYDAWGRLRQAQTLQVSAGTPDTFKLQWGYDQLGNRLSQSLLDGNLPNGAGVPSLTISTATNRITTPGYTYDGVGNMLHDAASAYTYDGANRLTTVNGTGAAHTYFGPLRINVVVG